MSHAVNASVASIALALLVGLDCGGGGTDVLSVDASDDAVAAGPVTFRLSYQSDVSDSIFVQSGTEFGGQGWVRVRTVAGTDLPILDDCGRCDCASCDACAVCGVGRPEVTAVASGAAIEWTWDGNLFNSGNCPMTGIGCETAVPLPAGNYVAVFCWSWMSDGVGPDHHVGNLTCGDVPFVYPLPAATVVEHHECACG